MSDEITLISIEITVNGKAYQREVEPRLLLVEFIRVSLGLTGTHIGCDTSFCGACTIILNGEAIKSCTYLAVQADGGQVITVEGLERDGQLHPLQQAFSECHGLQCGYCTPGMLIAAKSMLDNDTGDPSLQDIRKGLSGNFCGCTGYTKIYDAVTEAAGELRGKAGVK